MKIYGGRGTPIWLAERANGGLIVQMGSSRIMLSREELPQFCDAIYRLTGIRADSVAVTPAKARIQRYPATTP